MAIAVTKPTPDQSRRLLSRLPGPLWTGVATVVLAIFVMGLRFGLPIYRQQAAIREIERWGGHFDVLYWGPVWLRDWVGQRRLAVIVGPEVVGLHDTELIHRCMPHLEDLPSLKAISFDRSPVVDSDLIALTRLTKLRSLSLGGCTEITDAGLAHLNRLPALNDLFLAGTGVTDAGIAQLESLPLERLYLDWTQITDAGLKDVCLLRRLRLLWLSGTTVTDAGLANLRELTDLEHLNLDNTNITDAGLVHLGVLRNLAILSLINNRQVTDEGISELQRALPNVHVER